jgi:DNA-directed RNA polymerase subunit RPC12/RpoP
VGGATKGGGGYRVAVGDYLMTKSGQPRLRILRDPVRFTLPDREAARIMWNNAEQSEKSDLEDHGDSYLCRHCNREGLKPTFGMSIECPACGSTDIVCAKFWRRFKKISASEDA